MPAERIEWELPLTTASEIRCKNHSHSLGSPLSRATMWPISLAKRRERGPRTPEVSTANGVKMNRYLATFEASAEAAAEPGLIAEEIRLPEEKVHVQVASQMSDLPDRKGKRVMPSGRLPSPLSSPTGSSWDGKPAAPRPLLMISFKAEWRGKRPALMRQERG